MSDIFSWKSQRSAKLVKPWKPEPLNHEQWPPDYRAVYAWRIRQLAALEADPELVASARAYYSRRPVEFIMHWMDTYNPRKADNKWMPFVFFVRQAQFIECLNDCVADAESLLVEKCRDAGVTWLACGYSVHSWLFVENDAIGWGSRKEELVDKLGNPDSIFEKMRLILRRLPAVFLPVGFDMAKHTTFRRFTNPENGSVIMGEAGDNIGRGGRTRIYFKDESAHYERPEKIEASLGDNTNVQVDISSVNGLGNAFHRRREAGVVWHPGAVIEPGYTRVFIVDWRDHPEKTQEWYDRRKAKYEREGMLHVFAQEVDRNYAASVQNAIIPLEWIDACVDAHLEIPYLRKPPGNVWTAGFDIADGGIDRNALALRQWIIIRDVKEWGDRDVGVSTRRAMAECRQYPGIRVQYDSVGMGASIKAEYNRLVEEENIDPNKMQFVPWNAGAAVQEPYAHVVPDDHESMLNREFFQNFKAQAWWSVRTRCYKTFQARKHGVVYDADELISFDSSMPLLTQLKKELAQPTRSESGQLKMVVDKKPNGTRSPNLADAVIQAMFPADNDSTAILVGRYGVGS